MLCNLLLLLIPWWWSEVQALRARRQGAFPRSRVDSHEHVQQKVLTKKSFISFELISHLNTQHVVITNIYIYVHTYIHTYIQLCTVHIMMILLVKIVLSHCHFRLPETRDGDWMSTAETMVMFTDEISSEKLQETNVFLIPLRNYVWGFPVNAPLVSSIICIMFHCSIHLVQETNGFYHFLVNVPITQF